jgi:hypothetical protein
MKERDQRRSTRRPLHYRADIGTIGGEGSVPCVVRDVSDTGARVATHSPDQLPDEFILGLTNAGSLRRLCKVVWRSETEVGVSFVRPPRGKKVTEMGIAVQPAV